ncbi:hypothetical protein F2Q69_00007931 [Brassica cretica]|uniref:Uncharacterized protein n=1 Tax=Brassica cretica TaxID=69181 RepID=A0A8S9PCS0_BRACR|nr:hypothetical protein F2Q69_00007931 [Brassica cretica]
MPTMTPFQSRSHICPPEESMIPESLQLAIVESSMRQTTQHRSRLTQQHRSTVAISNRPTHHMKNRSIVVQMIGRTTTTTPLLPHTPDNTCIHKSMMKTMRMKELLSTKPSLMRRIHFYIIPLGKGMHHRSTYMAHHRSILNFIRETGNEHRPILPTTHRSTQKSTEYEKETTRLAVGQMITITKAIQKKQQYMSQEQMNYMKKDTKEFYDTAGGIDKSFKLRSRNPTRPSIDVDVPTLVERQPEFCRRAFDSHGTRKFFWEEKDEYGVYRDEHGYDRDLDGNTIRLHNMDIRRVLERASRDEPSYICLPEHATLFTQTKLVPEIYTKDEINEMFYGVCGEQEKNKKAFQMKLDGVYYPLNDSISYLTTCMEEMQQDIARIQHATDVARSSSIDRDQHTSTNEEIDQLVEDFYRALETTEERLDGRCDDIYFPMDLDISALTSKIEAIQGELVEIRSYIAHRPESSSSIDRNSKKSTDIHQRTSVDDATNRGRLVPKMTSDMSGTHYHGEEISADTYTALRRHQFNLRSLEERLQRMENTTATMNEKWRRGDEAMRDFTAMSE